MRNFSSILGVLLLAATMSLGAPTNASAEPQATKVADVNVQLAQHYGNRVCCKRGYRDWWSTWRQCRRSGGHVVANRACRDDRYSYRDRDHRYSYGGRHDRRVCCKRGYSDWWSTARQCRRAGGYVTSNRACRWD